MVVAGAVDDIGVVACPLEDVGTSAAVQEIVLGVAGDDVGEFVAGAGEISNSRENEIFDVGPERVGDRSLDGIDAGVVGFTDDVSDGGRPRRCRRLRRPS